MKNFKFWQAPYFAFFSTQFYRELGAFGHGVGFVYLLCLLLIATAVKPVKEFAPYQSALLGDGRALVEQMPEIHIKSGKLAIDQPSPYFVTDPQTGRYLLAFDTSGQSLTPSELNVPVLLTEDRVLARTERGDFQFKFNNIQNLHAHPQDLMHFLFVASYLLPVLSYLMALPLSWGVNIVMALGFSLAGLVLAKTINVDIKYEGILRITCAALGNVILIDAILQIFPLEIPGYGEMTIAIPSWFLYKFVLTLGFTLFGVGANLSPPSFQPAAEEAGRAFPER